MKDQSNAAGIEPRFTQDEIIRGLCENRVLAASTLAVLTMEEIFSDVKAEDYHHYQRLARAALESALAGFWAGR